MWFIYTQLYLLKAPLSLPQSLTSCASTFCVNLLFSHRCAYWYRNLPPVNGAWTGTWYYQRNLVGILKRSTQNPNLHHPKPDIQTWKQNGVLMMYSVFCGSCNLASIHINSQHIHALISLRITNSSCARKRRDWARLVSCFKGRL